jgi:hypothetical protein
MSPRSLAIALLAAAGLHGLQAQVLAQIPRLEPATAQALEAAGELRSSLAGGAVPRLLPQMPRRAQILEEVRALGLTAGVEMLSVYPGTGAPLDTPEGLHELYNLMHAVSRMKGLEYYSASRKHMRTLFAESYFIDDPTTRQPLPDRAFEGEIPPVDRAYLYQHDLTFGETVYRAEYYFEDGVLSLHTSNLTVMRYLGLPMIREGDSLSWICLVPFGSRILFYGLTGAKTMKFLGLEKSKAREESFYNRLKAIYGWYTRQLGD